jgi:hypothetical protein
MIASVLHIAFGSFEAFSCPLKPKLATERKPCWQAFTRHKLYVLLGHVFIFTIRAEQTNYPPFEFCRVNIAF